MEWIGEIPANWEVKRLKYLAKINASKPANLSDESVKSEVVFLPMEKVGEDGSVDQSILKNIDEVSRGFTYFERGDILIAKITPCFENGKGAHLKDLNTNVGFGSTEFHTIKSLKFLNPAFAYYQTKSNVFMKVGEGFMSGSAGQKRLPTSFVEDFPIPLPPLAEQTSIAEFLDRKTSQIDSLVEKKKRLIELLKEEKAAVINQAVTKGIDPNVKMKDSGVEWLGEVPEHWEVIPMTKYLESIIDYRGKTPQKIESGTFLVTARNIKEGKINYSISQEYVDTSLYDEIMRRGSLEIGDVLMTTEAPLGEVANVDKVDVAIAQRVIKFRALKAHLDNYFLKEWIATYTFQSYLTSLATGSTALGIKASKLNLLKLALPSIQEQISIVGLVRELNTKYSTMISKIEKEIELLQEYRTALISEVVTGKVRVG
ncbi:restriction endonuclease subunit S [Leptospira mtsangambouensis]|uniref:restriction endonuclease subunit S n=1 Tax=Leptospira mtsangambouensis TaxID=2484912 RepID=UPI00142E29B1|nr:restriction endonuclease subunit S [Leptospira mtsangambouensis]